MYNPSYYIINRFQSQSVVFIARQREKETTFRHTFTGPNQNVPRQQKSLPMSQGPAPCLYGNK